MKSKKQYSLVWRATLFLVLAIFPLNLLSLIANQQSYRAEQKNINTTMNYTMETYMGIIDNRIYNANSLLLSTNMTDNYGILYFQQRDGWQFQYDRYQLYTELHDYLYSANNADFMFFYAENMDDLLFITTNNDIDYDYKYDLEDLIVENDHTSTKWNIATLQNELFLIRFIYDEKSNITYGSAISLANTMSQIEEANNFETAIVGADTVIPEKSIMHTSYYASSKQSPLILSLTIDNSELTRTYLLGASIMTFSFIIYLSLIPILIYMFRRHIAKPLKILTDAHEELTLGNEDYRITEHVNSTEFQGVFDSFNTMSGTLKELREEGIKKEVANHALQLESLQLQIRPHFLLNSFHLLYTLIQTGQIKASQEFILYLSNYFRYMFRNGTKLALFSKEQALIEEYLEVAKLYYPDSFTVSYMLDPIISLVRVPPLLLHSFIENIIEHALVQDTVTNIVFAGEYEDGFVTFQISDNGRGLTPDAVDEINHLTKDSESNGKNVGIKNSVKRLKQYYGDAAGIVVESEENFGTTFTITIPYNLDEEDEEE